MSAKEERGGREIVFELCADRLEACRVAKAGGARRIELCAELDVDGLTPSHGLLEQAIGESGLPVFMLLRPHAGDFVYSAASLEVMCADLEHGKALGASGFALGLLLADGRVDGERTRALVELAAPLEVTFHRAFDLTPDPFQALEDVIATGCRRVLTSGGARDVVAGVETLRELVRRAAGRVEIAVGGGLRTAEATWLAEQTQARHFHGSVRHRIAGQASVRRTAAAEALHFEPEYEVRTMDLRALVDALELGATAVASST